MTAPIWRVAVCFLLGCGGLRGAETNTAAELRELRQENRQLQQQLAKQQRLIDSLASKVSGIEQAEKARGDGASPDSGKNPARTRLNISGQVATAYFKTGPKGQYPKGQFQVDEARLFLEGRAYEDVYGVVELDAMTREAYDDGVRIGEAYLEFERVLKWRGLDSLVNIRAGRFQIPFGEEYQVRYAIDNPLISHSLSDLWGIDEGVEIYGSYGRVQYAVALQNGGHPAVGDGTSDKSITARIAYEPRPWLRVSGSAMSTGDLSPAADGISEIWFANGFIHSMGNSVTKFRAKLAEGDVQFLFPRGHVKLAGGGLFYDDNDPSANNHRDVYYYYAEGMFRFTKQIYGAARFSQILAAQGYPSIGNGSYPLYGQSRTDNLWRLSAGVGYTPHPNLVLKFEYTLERGRMIGGPARDSEDFLGFQAALRF